MAAIGGSRLRHGHKCGSARSAETRREHARPVNTDGEAPGDRAGDARGSAGRKHSLGAQMSHQERNSFLEGRVRDASA